MTLQNQYLMVGQSAKNRLFGVRPVGRNSRSSNVTPLQMLVSQKFTISNCRLAVVVIGLFTLAMGIILSSIPWIDYIIMKNLKLLNGTLSYHYWHRPGVLRLTKVFIFNVTNSEGFLNNGEKPKLMEIGPFIYKEEMEKVNIKFHNNGTVSFQHNKILQFMPELSIPGGENLKLTIPNIPLLTVTTLANRFVPMFVRHIVNGGIYVAQMKPFKTVTAKEFIFGYDDYFTRLANKIFPEGHKPPEKMGLFLSRNGTLSDIASIYTGETGMQNFGLMNRLNGLDRLPYWDEPPCDSITASEGSLFPPKTVTKSDIVHVYDKDLCRIWPMKYRRDCIKDGITAGYYTPVDNIFDPPQDNANNMCFTNNRTTDHIRGLQDISPCQFHAPLYISFPHFFNADPSLLNAVEGLSPDREKHEPFLKIQEKLGVPLEARIRVQVNIKVEKSDMGVVSDFPSMVFPIMWVEEGVDDLPEHIHRWIYLATTVADNIVPIIQYGMIAVGSLMLIGVFVKSYQSMVFTRDNLERGKRTLRKGSNVLSGQHRLMILRDSYTLLNDPMQETDIDQEMGIDQEIELDNEIDLVHEIDLDQEIELDDEFDLDRETDIL